MIFGVLYCLATFLIPLKTTYLLLQNERQDKSSQQLWGVYWAIYSFLFLLRNYLPIFDIKAIEILIIAFCIWLYHPQYRGALYIKSRIIVTLNQNQIAKMIISRIKQWNATLNIFDTQLTNE